MREKKRQIYGSQLYQNYLFPVQDLDNLDKRRASVGLEPIAEYLEDPQKKWNIETYKKELPELIKKFAVKD
jgi:hypothetical protein